MSEKFVIFAEEIDKVGCNMIKVRYNIGKVGSEDDYVSGDVFTVHSLYILILPYGKSNKESTIGFETVPQ